MTGAIATVILLYFLMYVRTHVWAHTHIRRHTYVHFLGVFILFLVTMLSLSFALIFLLHVATSTFLGKL